MLKQIVKDNAKRILTKFMASTLIVTLSCTNFLVCGNYFVSYAAENNTNLDKQTDATLHKNVKFDAYFEEENNQTHYKTADLNNEEVELVLSTHVQKEGYLKNATIDLKNEENKNDINFTVTDIEDDNAIVQSASENQLVLRQINSGDKIEFKAKISAVKNISIERLNQISLITLKGLYIDAKGKETPIEKEIKINLAWTGKYEAQIKQSITKYIPIEQADGNKALISMQIETGLKAQNIMLPIKETNLEINVPIINGERPKQVTVNAISTEATNGATSENIVFTEDNWEYSESDAKIKINIKNEENKLGKNADIYIVNYIYSENVYTALAKGNTTINAKSNVSIKTYSADTFEECTAEANDQIILTEAIGKLISMQGENITESISKGKFYANINNPQSGDGTEFEFKWNINVGYSEGLNGIVLKDKADRMVAENNIIGNLAGKTIYKEVTFNSSSFDELLGEDGKVSIYNGEDRLLALIAKDSRTDTNGNYIAEFMEEVSNIKIVTSKPIKNGNLIISVKKEIKSDLGFTKSQIDNFQKIDVLSEIYQLDEKTNAEVLVEEKEVSIPLEATVTKSKISINREKLSTLVKNEDVEFTIELGNDNENSDLYVDPIFEIELPKEIENVEVLESKILFDEELLINKVEFIQKDGMPVLRIMLNGVQTKYSNGVVANGTNIVLKTNITVNQLSPSKQTEVKMYYYNSNTVNYDNGVQTDKGLGGLATTNIELVAPTGMITINGMQNYDGNGNTIMTLNQGDVLEQVETYRPARIIKMNISAINNTGNTCSDVVILGRIPFAGNTDLETKEDLGTTLDTYLRGYIKAENLEGDGLKIYYSENGEATSAIGDTENAWTLEPTDLSKVKSYMIVLNGYEMNQGEQINFSYDFEFPANIGYNQTINANYGIYYINNTQVASVSAFAKSNRVGITTGRGPELKILQTVEGTKEDGTVEAYKVLKFTISVNNTGTETAQNVTIKNEIPKWTCLVRPVDLEKQVNETNIEIYANLNNDAEIKEEWNVINDSIGGFDNPPVVKWDIPEIKPGEIVQKDIYVLTMNSPDIYSYYKDYPGFTIGDDGKYYIKTSVYNADTDTTYETQNEITSVPQIDVQSVTLVDADNITATLQASSEETPVEDTDRRVVENVTTSLSGKAMENEQITFLILLENPGNLNSIRVEKKLPDIFSYVKAELTLTDAETGEMTTISGNYDEETRTVTLQKDGLDENVKMGGLIEVKVNKLNDQEYSREIHTNVKVWYDADIEKESDDIILNIVKPQYTVKQQIDNSSSIINTGDVIEYAIVIENTSDVPITNMKMTTYVPEAFFIDKVTVTQYGSTITTYSKESEQNIEEDISLPEGENIIIKMKFKVLSVKEDTKTTLYTLVYGEGIDSTMTDMITQTIEQDAKYANNGDNNNGSNNGNNGGNNNGNSGTPEKTYKISGMVWEDKNENGQKDDNEKNLEGIVVNIIDATTGNKILDSNSQPIQVVTNSEGKYLLTNIKSGKYMLMFQYDNRTYTTTSYQKLNVSEIYNSNVIEKEITVDGEKMIVGVTDVIDVDSTKININLGLVNKAKFDLKLDKYITNITVQNGKGVKTYNFDNSTLAKVEIPASQVAKSTIVLEYKIVITNEGNVAGYAKNIVDYKPKDTTFNSSLNKNWYAGNDGNLYTTELENTLINPGETKEVKLILTKQMTESNTGMVNNIAEINSSYNEQGIDDRDSAAGNKAQGEDDMGNADAIITVKTGGTVMYTLLGIIILAILSIGIYIIKTKTLKGKEVYR